MNNLPTLLEVEEELHLHVELLQREYMQRGMSPEEARAATLKRFGNFDRVKNECVAICKRSQPLQRAFKIFLILLALTGLIIRFTSTDYYVARIGPILITIAIAGRLLLYVRGLSPSRFLPKNKPSSFSIFS
ncbi:MAG TPA: permease prefix domain 1-containing protein [Pyrinomonadaceae bacterium]|nr:permease prefix domain 1-containing protein [Pyrinomonadaceae bacterium]